MLINLITKHKRISKLYTKYTNIYLNRSYYKTFCNKDSNKDSNKDYTDKIDKIKAKLMLFKDNIEIIVQNKLILSNLLDSKIYHYSILGSETNELIDLQNINFHHVQVFKKFSQMYSLNLSNNSCKLEAKSKILILSTLGLVYFDFIKFIKNYNENLEEKINDLIRDLLEEDIDQDIIKTYFQKLRDDWRTCFNPEVLTDKLDPTHNTNVISNASIFVNDYITKLL